MGSSSDSGYEPDWDNFGETENVDADEDYGRRDQEDEFYGSYMLARVSDAVGPIWGWAPLREDGCTTTFDTSATSLTFEWVSWTYNSDNHIAVLSCDNNDDDCELKSEMDNSVTVTSGVTDVPYDPDPQDIEAEQPAISMLWAMTYADKEQGFLDNLVAYGAYWSDDAPFPSAVTTDKIAGRPTVNIHSGANLRKFTVAHEYGHVQTITPLLSSWQKVSELVDFCFPDTCDPGDTPNHDLNSIEWQAVAAIEGFAHFYSMAVWNDVPGDQGVLAKPGENLWEIIAYNSTDTYTVGMQTYESILQTTLASSCMQMDPAPCPSCTCSMGQWTGCDCGGAAVELDWNFFLWDLMGGSPALAIEDVIGLLAQSYTVDTGWPDVGDDTWWSEFESDAQAEFSTQAEKDRISDEAEDRGIDQ